MTHRHFLHGLAYLHSGSPRTWYGISGDDFGAVEDAAKREITGGGLKLHDAVLSLPALISPATMSARQIQAIALR